MKRIGLINVDGGKNFPNIPLMKISAWHKAHGDTVEWYMPFSDRYDDVYISKVFSFSPDYDLVVNADMIHRGGTGYAISIREGREVYDKVRDAVLPEEVEHMMPDYSIYPRLTKDTAFGFLTRGCPRGCPFCHVSYKEGRCSRKVADLSEFWNGQKNVVVCDPNLLASKDWRLLCGQLIDSGAFVDINQGLDIRLMTEEKLLMIDLIKMKEIYFAWDTMTDKEFILPKFQMFAEKSKHMGVSGKSHNITVYTICNYNTTIKQDLERIYTLRDMGYSPYVCLYRSDTCGKEYKMLQRWCNNRFIFASCERFEDYGIETNTNEKYAELFQ